LQAKNTCPTTGTFFRIDQQRKLPAQILQPLLATLYCLRIAVAVNKPEALKKIAA